MLLGKKNEGTIAPQISVTLPPLSQKKISQYICRFAGRDGKKKKTHKNSSQASKYYCNIFLIIDTFC
jgi:hypothetical protein